MEKLAELIDILFDLFFWALVVYVVMGWVAEWRNNRVYEILAEFFGRLLDPIRRIIPPIGGTLDLSPVILALLMSIVQATIAGFLK